MKNIPDHDGNRIYDLWNASKTELRGQVGSSMWYFKTESGSFDINVYVILNVKAEHWASILKVVGSILAVFRHIFQLVRCGCT